MVKIVYLHFYGQLVRMPFFNINTSEIMKKYHFLLIFIFSSLFSNCSLKTETQQFQSTTLIVIEDIKERKEMLFSEIGRNIDIIQLDNDCLMGQINKLVYSDNKYFALDIDQCFLPFS